MHHLLIPAVLLVLSLPMMTLANSKKADRITVRWQKDLGKILKDKDKSQGLVIDAQTLGDDISLFGNGGSDREEAMKRVLSWFEESKNINELKRFIIDYVNAFMAIVPVEKIPQAWQPVYRAMREVGPDGNHFIVRDIVDSRYVPSLKLIELEFTRSDFRKYCKKLKSIYRAADQNFDNSKCMEKSPKGGKKYYDLVNAYTTYQAGSDILFTIPNILETYISLGEQEAKRRIRTLALQEHAHHLGYIPLKTIDHNGGYFFDSYIDQFLLSSNGSVVCDISKRAPKGYNGPKKEFYLTINGVPDEDGLGTLEDSQWRASHFQTLTGCKISGDKKAEPKASEKDKTSQLDPPSLRVEPSSTEPRRLPKIVKKEIQEQPEQESLTPKDYRKIEIDFNFPRNKYEFQVDANFHSYKNYFSTASVAVDLESFPNNTNMNDVNKTIRCAIRYLNSIIATENPLVLQVLGQLHPNVALVQKHERLMSSPEIELTKNKLIIKAEFDYPYPHLCTYPKSDLYRHESSPLSQLFHFKHHDGNIGGYKDYYLELNDFSDVVSLGLLEQVGLKLTIPLFSDPDERQQVPIYNLSWRKSFRDSLAISPLQKELLDHLETWARSNHLPTGFGINRAEVIDVILGQNDLEAWIKRDFFNSLLEAQLNYIHFWHIAFNRRNTYTQGSPKYPKTYFSAFSSGDEINTFRNTPGKNTGLPFMEGYLSYENRRKFFGHFSIAFKYWNDDHTSITQYFNPEFLNEEHRSHIRFNFNLKTYLSTLNFQELLFLSYEEASREYREALIMNQQELADSGIAISELEGQYKNTKYWIFKHTNGPGVIYDEWCKYDKRSNNGNYRELDIIFRNNSNWCPRGNDNIPTPSSLEFQPRDAKLVQYE